MALKYGQQYYAGFAPASAPEFDLYGGLGVYGQGNQNKASYASTSKSSSKDNESIKIAGTYGNTHILAQSLRTLEIYEQNLLQKAYDGITSHGANAKNYMTSEEGVQIMEELTNLQFKKTMLHDQISNVADHGSLYESQRKQALIEHTAGNRLFLRKDKDGKWMLNINDGGMTVQERYNELYNIPMLSTGKDGSVEFNPVENPYTSKTGAFSEWVTNSLNSIKDNFNKSTTPIEINKFGGFTPYQNDYELFLSQISYRNNRAQIDAFKSGFMSGIPEDALWELTNSSYEKILQNINDLKFDIEPRNLVYGRDKKAKEIEIGIYKEVLEYEKKYAEYIDLVKKRPDNISDEEYQKMLYDKDQELNVNAYNLNQKLKYIAEDNNSMEVARIAQSYYQSERDLRQTHMAGYGQRSDIRYVNPLQSTADYNNPNWNNYNMSRAMGKYGQTTYNGKVMEVGNLSDYNISRERPYSIPAQQGGYVYTKNNLAIPMSIMSHSKGIVGSVGSKAMTMPIATFNQNTGRFEMQNPEIVAGYNSQDLHSIAVAFNNAYMAYGSSPIIFNSEQFDNFLETAYENYLEAHKKNETVAKYDSFDSFKAKIYDPVSTALTSGVYKDDMDALKNAMPFVNFNKVGDNKYSFSVKDVYEIKSEYSLKQQAFMPTVVEFSVEDLTNITSRNYGVDNPYFRRSGDGFQYLDYDNEGKEVWKDMEVLYDKIINEYGNEVMVPYLQMEVNVPTKILDSAIWEYIEEPQAKQDATDNYRSFLKSIVR